MSRYGFLLFAAAFALSSGIVTAFDEPKKKDSKKETQNLQGTWSVESQIIGGKESKGFPTYITIEANRFVVKSSLEIVQSGELVVNESQDPKTLDFKVTKGAQKGKTVLCIFQLEGDSLKMCGDPEGKLRPAKFEAPEGSNAVLIVHKRLSHGANEPDAKAIQGSWRVTHLEEEGKAVPADKLSDLNFAFKNNTLSMKVEGKTKVEGTFDFISKTAPKQIDWIVKDELTAGIYKLEKNRLTICITSIHVLGFMNKKRPTEFATKADSRTNLIVLERTKD